MGNVKKSVAERKRHKRQYDIRVNKKQMHASKVDSSKALDADLVVMKSNRTESGKQDTSSSLRNYLTHVVDVDIRVVNDQMPFAEINELKAQLQAKNSTINNLNKQIKNVHEKSNEAKVKHDIDVIETINIELEHKVAKLLKENETLKKHYKDLYDYIKVTRTKTIEQTTSLIAKYDEFKAQLQEKGFIVATLKNELRKLKGNSVDTKFAKPSILRKPVLQPYRNQSELDNQMRLNLNDPIFQNHSSSRNSSKESYGLNDMAHKYYLEVAKKKTQDKNINLKPSVMHTTSLQNTTNGSKPKPRSNNQTSRSLLVPKSSCDMSKGVPLVDHSRNSRSFSDSKQFVCSNCQKCVFNADHDDCITKLLKEVNSRAKVQSPKSRNNIKPEKRIPNVNKPERMTSKGYTFSPNKSSPQWMRNQTLLDLVLGGNRRVEFSRLLVLGGYLLAICSPIAQPKLTVNLQMVQMMISLTHMNAIKLLMSVQTTLQALLLKEKKSVRFSAIYLQKKKNLLAGTPSSTTTDQDAPSTSHSPSSSEVQAPILHQGVAAGPTFEDNPFAQAENDPFVNLFSPEPKDASSGMLYTSSLLNAACKNALNLLKKRLLVREGFKTTSNEEYRDELQIANMDKMTVLFLV
uniref:Integrase, catalytic region, zinc finger, CCHC-type, peptidase aspartic, catalytic n=1 Tax=Tanacetum cinerariifolium TaxID=118510 RepID=A0A699GMW3_TANCI|nr:hypothetical protein [Tanacetum cinerariifolium]